MPEKFKLRRADVWVVLFALLLAGAFFFLQYVRKPASGPATVALVVDGALLREERLPAEGEVEIAVPGIGGENVVALSPRGARVLASDCPGQDCVRQGEITQAGQSIACLPHRVLIRLEGDEAEVDTIVR